MQGADEQNIGGSSVQVFGPDGAGLIAQAHDLGLQVSHVAASLAYFVQVFSLVHAFGLVVHQVPELIHGNALLEQAGQLIVDLALQLAFVGDEFFHSFFYPALSNASVLYMDSSASHSNDFMVLRSGNPDEGPQTINTLMGIKLFVLHFKHGKPVRRVDIGQTIVTIAGLSHLEHRQFNTIQESMLSMSSKSLLMIVMGLVCRRAHER